MAATDPATLLASANCYQCYQGTDTLMMLALLRQIVLNGNPMADVSPQALLEQAKCYRCYQGTEWLLILALLSQIASGTAGGGGLLNRPAPTGNYGVDEPPPPIPGIVWDLKFLNEMPGLRWQPDATHANGGYWLGFA